jgi:hypothetical protein
VEIKPFPQSHLHGIRGTGVTLSLENHEAPFTYCSFMNIFGTKTTKILVALFVASSSTFISVPSAMAACTVSIRNTTSSDDRYTDTAHQIRYEFNWTCSETSGESWAKVSTSNAMIDRAGDVAPSGYGSGINGYGGGFGGLTSELQPSTTYFVQGFAKTSSGTYSSEIIAITTTSEEAAARNTTTTTSPAPSNTPDPTTSNSGGGTPSSTANTSAPANRVSSVTTVQDAIEDDGVEDDFAEINVRLAADKFDLRINSSYPETEMIIRARKPGSRVIVWSITTNTDGSRRILTSRNLSGYTLSLLVDAEVFHRVRIR